MDFYLVFYVFYVYLVHIFPPSFSVRRHGIQEVSGSFLIISAKDLIYSEIKVFSCFYDLQSVIFFGLYQKENADLCAWFLTRNYEIKRTDLMAEIRLR